MPQKLHNLGLWFCDLTHLLLRKKNMAGAYEELTTKREGEDVREDEGEEQSAASDVIY